MNTTKRLVIALAVFGLSGCTLFAKTKVTAPLKIHMISGSNEYQSEKSLTAFKIYLEKHYNIACTLSLAKDKGSDIPGIEKLDSADVMLVFCRRLKPPQEQLERIKNWCKAGKPVIGIRTASHGFGEWPEFDKAILGGDYKGHGGKEQVGVLIEDKARKHPILVGVKQWSRVGKLYRNPNLAKDVTVLLTGVGPKDKQPVAWARTYNKEKNARSFYTSISYPEDFENENYKRMLINAISWSSQRKVERKASVPSVTSPDH